jgi:GAF domain-containing protein
MPRRNRWRLPEPAPTSERHDHALAVVSEIAHAISRADDPAEAFQFAIDRAAPAVGATLGAVFVLDPGAELMRAAAAHNWPDRWRPWLGEMRVRVGFGPAGEAASERRLIAVPDVFADPGLEDWQEVARELGFRALVSLPLEAGGLVLGAVSFYFTAPGTPDAAAKALMRTVADLLAVIAERDALRTRLRHAQAALEDEPSVAVIRKSPVEDNEATAE